VKIKIGLIFIFLLMGVSGFALYNTIEFYDETIKQNWSRKALINPYLAAEQFLALRGNNVESSSRMKRLDQLPEKGTIFINDSRQLKKQERIDALLNWMKRGGRLVVGGHLNRSNNKNLLFDYFDVTIKKADCDCEDNINGKKESKEPVVKKFSKLLREIKEKQDKEKSEESAEFENDIPVSELTSLNFENIENSLQIHFDHSTTIDHPVLNDELAKNYNGPKPFYFAKNKAGPHFMQFYVGEGLFTVLSDGSIWESRSIDKVDHALLLLYLLGSNNKIVLLRGMQMPSILELLTRYVPELLFASMVWLLIWLLYKIKRFGPIREQNISVRRSLDEHIVASAGHIWRSKKGNKIIENIHTIIFHKIRRKNLGFTALDKKQQVNWVSQHCILSEKEVVTALYTEEVASEEHLNKIVRLIQKIGNRL